MPNYKMVMCRTCARLSLYDVDTLPKDERGNPLLENCKREARKVKANA